MTKEEILTQIIEEYPDRIIKTQDDTKSIIFDCFKLGCEQCPAKGSDCSRWLDDSVEAYFKQDHPDAFHSCNHNYSGTTSASYVKDIEHNSDITVAGNGWEKETKKDGKVKTMFQLVDPYFYEGFADILTLGAQKYKPNNWVDGSHDEYSRAVESHWNEYKKGNKLDEESGKSHLYHIACNLMFLDYFDRKDVK